MSPALPSIFFNLHSGFSLEIGQSTNCTYIFLSYRVSILGCLIVKCGYRPSAGTNTRPSTCPQKCRSVLYNTHTTLPYGIRLLACTLLNNY
jgi:hypothetical protein